MWHIRRRIAFFLLARRRRQIFHSEKTRQTTADVTAYLHTIQIRELNSILHVIGLCIPTYYNLWWNARGETYNRLKQVETKKKVDRNGSATDAPTTMQADICGSFLHSCKSPHLCKFHQTAVSNSIFCFRFLSFSKCQLVTFQCLPFPLQVKAEQICRFYHVCLRGSLAQCALSLKRLSAGPGFNPQNRQNNLFQDYWRACFEINFSDRQEGLTVSSNICDR